MDLEQRFFTYVGWDEQEVFVLSFYYVEFINDFGIFKKGDKFDSVCLDYKLGELTYFNEVDNTTITQKFTLVPE